MDADPTNHCVRLLDHFPVPNEANLHILVTPLLKSYDKPHFETIGECVAFFEQVFDVRTVQLRMALRFAQPKLGPLFYASESYRTPVRGLPSPFFIKGDFTSAAIVTALIYLWMQHLYTLFRITLGVPNVDATGKVQLNISPVRSALSSTILLTSAYRDNISSPILPRSNFLFMAQTNRHLNIKASFTMFQPILLQPMSTILQR